jgi:hypothetical protein
MTGRRKAPKRKARAKKEKKVKENPRKQMKMTTMMKRRE